MKNDINLKISYWCVVCMILAVFLLICFDMIYLSSPWAGLYDETASIIIFIIEIFIAIFFLLATLFIAITMYNSIKDKD